MGKIVIKKQDSVLQPNPGDSCIYIDLNGAIYTHDGDTGTIVPVGIGEGSIRIGSWDASSNVPVLSDNGGGGSQGQYFEVSVAGYTPLDGLTVWAVGDLVINDGGVWTRYISVVTDRANHTGTQLLDTISDVNAGTATNRQRLGWDELTGTWIPMFSTSALGFIELDYNYKTSVDATPNAKEVARDNTDSSLTTILYFNMLDRESNDVSFYFEYLTSGNWINLHDRDDFNNRQAYDVIGAPVLVGDVWQVPVSFYEETGTLLTNGRIRVAIRVGVSATNVPYMLWKGEWVPQIYEKNDVVRDGLFLSIANTSTSDRPAWVYSTTLYDLLSFGDTPATWAEQNQTTSQLLTAQRVAIDANAVVTTISFYVPASNIGMNIALYYVSKPTTNPVVNIIIPSFVATANNTDKWVDVAISDLLTGDGTMFDFILETTTTSGEQTFTHEWDYLRQDGNPTSGEMLHQGGGNDDELFVHQEDSGGTNRSLELDNIVAGSTIIKDDELDTWVVQSVIKVADVYQFVVVPSNRATASVSNFTFKYTGIAPTYYYDDVDYYIGEANVQGFTSINGYSPIANPPTLNNDAYGMNLSFREVTKSDDWDSLAVSGSPSSGDTTGLSALNNLPYGSAGLSVGKFYISNNGSVKVVT